MSAPLSINWNNISQQEFLEKYWQKQPVVLKNALPDLAELTDENELAGLAMEEFIDSRIVENNADEWQVSHGPFSDFSRWQDGKWSLLVQGVDRYLPDVQSLLNTVNFVPKWRVDDVMVSFSMPGAGVGLHLDQYDVFIVQGKGKRRWQAGKVDKSQCQNETTEDLLQLSNPEAFEPIVDEVLENGDIIYVPPFSAHKGETLENAINYSIGFRAPSQQELLWLFADHLIENDLGLKRFQSSSTEPSSEFLPDSDIKEMQKMLIEVVQDEKVFKEFCQLMYTEEEGE